MAHRTAPHLSLSDSARSRTTPHPLISSRRRRTRNPRSARPATMAALRYAAKRLGGSLLHRTQAAVEEEGRRLAPSRIFGEPTPAAPVAEERRRLRSHNLSSHQHARAHSARQVQQKKEELYEAVSKAEQKKQELLNVLAEQENLANEQHFSAQSTQGPAAPLPWKVYTKRARGVLDVACKATFFVYAGAFLLGITGTGRMLGLTSEVVREAEIDE